MKKFRLHFLSRPSFKDGRGFTLIEVAIVLAIAGIVLAGIWAAVANVSESNRINAAAQELQTISSNMITLYENRKLPTTPCNAKDMTDNAIKAGVIPLLDVSPTDIFPGCQAGQNPWGGYLEVYGNASGSLAIQNFRISFYNIPMDACIALLLKATSCDPAQNICPADVFTADGTTGTVVGYSPGPPKSWSNMNINKASGTTLCGANTGGLNSLEFEFQL